MGMYTRTYVLQHWSEKKGTAVCLDRLNLVLTTSFCIVYFNSMSSLC